MALPNPLYALVLEEYLKITSNNIERYFCQYTLRTTVGNLKTMMWNATARSMSDPNFLHKGDLVVIDDLEDQLDTHRSIVVHHFKRISKEELPDAEKSICELPKTDPKKIAKAWSVIGDKNLYEVAEHRSFVSKCFSKLDRKVLEICPAASRIHHSMAAGLIIHTAEVIKIAKAIYDYCHEDYPFIDNDVLMASCAVHDLGKVKTYIIDELGFPEKTMSENMLGHMYFGIELVQSVGKEMGIDQKFIDEVSHAIAAHHGKIEFGNIKPIQSMEALILHVADLVSSRNGMVENKLQEITRVNSILPEILNIYSDSYFASIGMQRYVKERII